MTASHHYVAECFSGRSTVAGIIGRPARPSRVRRPDRGGFASDTNCPTLATLRGSLFTQNVGGHTHTMSSEVDRTSSVALLMQVAEPANWCILGCRLERCFRSSLAFGIPWGVDFEEDCMRTENQLAEQMANTRPTSRAANGFSDRDVGFRNLYQCPYCETLWGTMDTAPGKLSDCPSCRENEVRPYTWYQWNSSAL